MLGKIATHADHQSFSIAKDMIQNLRMSFNLVDRGTNSCYLQNPFNLEDIEIG